MNAVAGRRPDAEDGAVPLRPDAARVATTSTPASRDMDINGIWAAVNFPSMITGFCGRVFFNAKDPELGQACIRAWNDWLYEEWYIAVPRRASSRSASRTSSDPRGRGRRDPPQRRARLHRRSRMPERPHLIGLPDLWERDHWDPIIQACVDTDTVISLHVGSSGGADEPRRRAVVCSSAPRCSASSRCTRAPSGCGPGTR